MDLIDRILKRLDRLETVEQGGKWTTWTPTPVGWSGSPTLACRRLVIGQTVWFTVYADGTSDSAAASIPLPFTAASVYGWGGACNYVLDNGVAPATPARWVIDYGSSSIVFYKTFAGGAWTASGNKLVMAEGFYQIP